MRQKSIPTSTQQNAALWEEVETYIRKHYDQDVLRCVYISSDGGGWIRAAEEHIYKGRLVADRFHLTKYINRAAGCTQEKGETKEHLYKYIYKNNLLAVKKLLTRIENRCERSRYAVEESRKYLEGNWEYIQRAFHDKHVLGCSAEGHVSSVYSERMSSRPMGWSKTGADRMCRLRCFIRNYGREKVIELVNYRRERELGEIPQGKGTGGNTGNRNGWYDRYGSTGELYSAAERSAALCREDARNPGGEEHGT